MSDVKPGDLVRLKSGGPLMVVSHVSSQGMCSVRWFADGSMREGMVFAAALGPEPEPEPEPEEKATDDVPRDANGVDIRVGDFVRHQHMPARTLRVRALSRYPEGGWCVQDCGGGSAAESYTVIGRAL